MGSSDVSAYELESGEQRWYAGSDDGLFGFFGEDSERAIHLTASEHEVYVGRASPTEHAVTALDGDDGSTRWELSDPEMDDDHPYTDSSVYAPASTFLGLDDDGLVAGGTGWAGAFGPDTEGVRERWLDRERMSCASPVVGEGLVVLPEFDFIGQNEDDEPEEHALTAFDTEEGHVEWEVTSDEPFGDVVRADGTLYTHVTRDDDEQTEEVGGELLAIDVEGGTVDTLVETPWDGRAVTAGGESLVLSGSRVGPRHRAIGAYGLDGEERWTKEVEANGFRPNPREVVFVDDRIYVGTGNGDVLAYG
jgi:outer membrane protein assembly factor BamB